MMITVGRVRYHFSTFNTKTRNTLIQSVLISETFFPVLRLWYGLTQFAGWEEEAMSPFGCSWFSFYVILLIPIHQLGEKGINYECIPRIHFPNLGDS